MVSRIFLQLNLHNHQKTDIQKRQIKSPSKTSTRPPNTPRGLAQSPIIPIKPQHKILEIKKICYIKPNEPTSKAPFLSTRQIITPDLPRCSSISPRKIRSAVNKIKQKTSTEEFSPCPALPRKTFYNERLLWKTRKIDLPLCIVNFNGIVGEFWKNEQKKSSSGKIRTVPGVKQGFDILSRNFLVAIVSWSKRCDTRAIIEFLDENNIKFDAFYIVRHRKFKYRFRHNYSQIFQDFQQLTNPDCIILLPLTIPTEEMQERKGPDLFYESSQSGPKRFTTIGMPDTFESPKSDPLCILLPHCNASTYPISLIEISKYLKSIIKDKIISSIMPDGRIHLPSENEAMGTIPKKPTNILTGIKYLVYAGCLNDSKRLISRRSLIKLK